MEHWEYLKPDGLRFVWDDTLFRPGTDSFLLSSLPKLSAGLRVCDLGCGTGLLGLLLLQKQSELTVTGIDMQPALLSACQRKSLRGQRPPHCPLRNRGESDGYLRRRVLSAAVGRKILSGPQAGTADGHSLRSAGGGHGTQAAALRPEPTGHSPFPLFDRGLPGR